jgi:hypothetical protein
VRSKILAFVTGGVLKFEGVHMRAGISGGDVNALRKWMEAFPKPGPFVCKVCQESVGAEGERVAVWVDLADPSHFEVMHRQHAD